MSGDISAQIQSLIDSTAPGTGTVGVATRRFEDGDEILINPDVIFPTASTFKTVLLYELYRQADAGKVDPATRITITDQHRVPGSGVIQDFDEGASLTIKDVATLMITVSDNAGTDIIFDLLGKDAIASAVRGLEMENTSIPLPTWDLLAGLQDLDPRDPTLTYQELKRKLKEMPRRFGTTALKETPDNDISTPRDMLKLHQAIHDGTGLSDTSQAAVLDILKRQKFGERIPAHLPRKVSVAHKTGSLTGVRNDVGIVYPPDAPAYAISIMVKSAENEVAAVRLIADVSKLIYEHYVGPVA